MQLNTLQLNDKSITLEPGLPLLIGTVNGGRSALVGHRTQFSACLKYICALVTSCLQADSRQRLLMAYSVEKLERRPPIRHG